MHIADPRRLIAFIGSVIIVLAVLVFLLWPSSKITVMPDEVGSAFSNTSKQTFVVINYPSTNRRYELDSKTNTVASYNKNQLEKITIGAETWISNNNCFVKTPNYGNVTLNQLSDLRSFVPDTAEYFVENKDVMTIKWKSSTNTGELTLDKTDKKLLSFEANMPQEKIRATFSYPASIKAKVPEVICSQDGVQGIPVPSPNDLPDDPRRPDNVFNNL